MSLDSAAYQVNILAVPIVYIDFTVKLALLACSSWYDIVRNLVGTVIGRRRRLKLSFYDG